MLYKSPVYSEARGKIAGLVYSRNAGGAYTRQYVKPVNPATDLQSAIRYAFASAAASWALDLTDAEQAAWKNFAAAVPVQNKVGDTTHLSGQNWYAGSATLRHQAGLDIVYAGPSIYAMPTLTPPSFAVVHSATTVSVTFDNTDEWANQDGGALAIFASRPQNPGRNYFSGPYRLAGVILGDGTTPPTSPAVITLPYTAGSAGTKIGFRAVAMTEDGRYTRGTSTLQAAS